MGTVSIMANVHHQAQWYRLAIRSGNIACVRFLLPLVSSGGVAGHDEDLIAAVKHSDPAMLTVVLEGMKDVDSMSTCILLTAVHMAAVLGHFEHIAILLPWLSRVDDIDDDDQIVREVEAMLTAALVEPLVNRQMKIATVLTQILLQLDLPSAIDDALSPAVRSGNLPMVELLLNAGAIVRRNGNEALRMAEQCGHPAIAALLTQWGAGFN